MPNLKEIKENLPILLQVLAGLTCLSAGFMVLLLLIHVGG